MTDDLTAKTRDKWQQQTDAVPYSICRLNRRYVDSNVTPRVRLMI